MINTICKIVVLALLMLVAFPLSAQEGDDSEDFELWLSGTAKMKIHKKFRLDLEQQVRFDDKLSSFEQYFTEFGLRYKINESLSLKGQYRYAVTDREHNESRWSLDLSYTYDIKNSPLDIKYRFRFQDEKVAWTDQKKTNMRHRLTLDYNLSKKVDPYLAYESFFKFNDAYEFRRNRYTFGLQWKLNKEAELVSFIRMEDEFNVKRPERIYVAGFAYSLKLDLRKKKKKKK